MRYFKIIPIIILLFAGFAGFSQNLTTAEYFFDADPGVGNGVPVSFTADDTVNFITDVSINGLSEGFHIVFFRVKDENGIWSLYQGGSFYIRPESDFQITPQLSGAEYFFDNDPGIGNGTPIPITTADTVDVTVDLPLTGLSEGFHIAFIRTRDAGGKWSLSHGRTFYILPDKEVQLSPPLTGIEYFFNDDPGAGNGNPVAVSKSDTLDVVFDVDISTLNEGENYLFVRVKDSAGVWSFFEKDTFRIFTCSDFIATFPYNEDFEDGSNGWTSGGTDPSWEFGTPSNTIISSASSGANAWVTDLDGDYNNNEASYVQSPCFDLSVLTGPVIDLDIWYNTDGNNDGAALLASKDGGETWTKVGDFGDTINWYDKNSITGLDFTEDLDGWGGTIAKWKTATHVLEDFTGEQYVKFRIVFGSNDDITYEGFGFDDIRIYDAIKDLSVEWISPPDEPDCGTTGDQKITVEIYNPGIFPVSGFDVSYSIDDGQNFVTEYCTETIQPNTSFEYIFTSTANMSAVDTYKCIAAVSAEGDEDPSNDTVHVSVTNNTIVIGIETEDTHCNLSEGTARVTDIEGGFGPYSYAWTNGDTTSLADSLASGIYVVTVTDSYGCTNFAIASVSDIGGPQIATEPVITHVTCNGGSDGAIDITVSGGTTPWSYAWSNGATTQDIQNLVAGPYEVVVTDADSCVAIKSYTVTEPNPFYFATSIIEATCGMADGVGTVIVSGGTSPYSYAWDTGGDAPTEVGLSAGVYTVEVTDANGCLDSAHVVMTESGAPKITLNSIVSANCGMDDGAIYISVSGGSGDYSYNWSNGATTEDLVNVPPGVYSVTVIDNLGTCDGVASYRIPAILPDVNPICLVTVDSLTQRNLVVWEKEVTEGVAYYNIYRESSVKDVFQLVGSRHADSLSVFLDSIADPSVRSWRYKLSVLDSCGNESALSDPHKTIHLTMNIGLGNTVNLIWDHYEGFYVGTYNVYRYSAAAGWENIASLPSNLKSYTDNNPPYDENLYYMIQVDHPSGGCIATESKASTYNTVRSNRVKTKKIQPGYYTNDLSVEWLSPPDEPDCGTTVDQRITVEIYNSGVSAASGFNVSYSIDDGQSFVTEYCSTTIEPGTSFEYTFNKTANMSDVDIFECVAAVSADGDIEPLNDTVRVSIPNNTMVIGIETEDTYCNLSEGTAQVTDIEGGFGSYSYAWTNGDTTSLADSLASGIYVVTVTDSYGCTNFVIASINDIGGPQIASEPLITHVTCNGGSDGAIDITVSGGTTPWSYTWSNGATTQDIQNLVAGPYEVIVTDADSCVAIGSYMVTEPNPLYLTTSIIKATCGMADGDGAVNVSGGTSPYSYAWDTGGDSPTEVGLSAGVYTVEVTDANGCMDSTHVVMTESGGPKITLNSIVSASCGMADGAIDISVSGGSGDYSYNWSNGATTEDLADLSSGLYSITVTDNQGTCDGVASYKVPVVLPDVNPICLVTVDSLTQRNLVVWEKEVTAGVAYYNIYRESSVKDVFQLVGSRHPDSLSVFLDSVADPSMRSWRYKLSVTDGCGNESVLSDPHKTIHLSMNVGLENRVNLVWDHYEGFDAGTCNVLRYSASTGGENIASLPGNLKSFTDNDPPYDENLYYMIQVDHPSGGCVATESKTGTFTIGRSNRVGTKIIQTGNYNPEPEFYFALYPNPVKDQLTLELRRTIEEQLIFEIIDTEGRICYLKEYYPRGEEMREMIDLRTIQKGFYIIRIRCDNSIFFRKLIKQ